MNYALLFWIIVLHLYCFVLLSIFRLVFVDTSMIHVFSRSYDSTALLHQFLMMMAMILAWKMQP